MKSRGGAHPPHPPSRSEPVRDVSRWDILRKLVFTTTNNFLANKIMNNNSIVISRDIEKRKLKGSHNSVTISYCIPHNPFTKTSVYDLYVDF